MNSTRLPSGSRTYTLEAGTWRPPRRSTGPSMMVAAAPVQQHLQRFSRSFPHQADVAARGQRRGGAEREVAAAPHLGSMKVDHLGAEMDLEQVGGLGDRQAERTVEARHGFAVLHRECDVVETGDGPGRSEASRLRPGAQTRGALHRVPRSFPEVSDTSIRLMLLQRSCDIAQPWRAERRGRRQLSVGRSRVCPGPSILEESDAMQRHCVRRSAVGCPYR